MGVQVMRMDGSSNDQSLARAMVGSIASAPGVTAGMKRPGFVKRLFGKK